MGGQDKVWIHYRKDIIAADVSSAIFLSAYLRHGAIHRLYIPCLEVIDLQRYKVVKQAVKVKVCLIDRMHIPFVFAVCKN
jgi:hypothetical protein